MTLRLLTLPLVATLLTACGGSGQPATPAAPATPPTEVAAVKTPPPQYPIELACSGMGGTTTLKVVVGVEGKPTDVNGQNLPATIQVPVSFNPPQPRPDECFAVEERLRRGG